MRQLRLLDGELRVELGRSGRRVVQLVFGPGCDGESSIGAMQEAVRRADESGQLLGVLPLTDDLVPEMAEMASALRPSRTPNILAKAAGSRLLWSVTSLLSASKLTSTKRRFSSTPRALAAISLNENARVYVRQVW